MDVARLRLIHKKSFDQSLMGTHRYAVRPCLGAEFDTTFQ